mmetsp:Transcript_11563/g.30919  ORF Transcript_11563/g.30919 Transcript_11563/m.30919 type:complete len:538 (+) Transcript_11563:88-1701(+)
MVLMSPPTAPAMSSQPPAELRQTPDMRADDFILTQTQPMTSQITKVHAKALVHPAQLISLIDHNFVYKVEAEQREVRVGRHPQQCQIVVKDKRVSSCHLRIYRDDAFRYFVEEMSANGCFVNEVPMKKGDTRALVHGDEISICVPGPSHVGEHEPFAAYLFRMDDNSSATSAPASEKASGSEVIVGGDKTGPSSRFVTEQWVRSNWDLRVLVGSGNFSDVKLGVHVANGVKRAVKVADKSKFLTFRNKRDSQLSLSDEANMLIQLQHPGIVRCFDWFQTDEHLYLVMEFVEGGDLLKCIMQDGRLMEGQARRIFCELGHAVSYLHARSIVHRDLKPDNILLTSKHRDTMHPKIGDFGLARKNMRSRDCRTFCGTPHYFAPEVINTFRDQEAGATEHGYGKPADMWSLGVVLYIMLCGIPPFEDEGLYEQIQEGRYEFDVDEWTEVSPEAKELVRRLMTVDPNGRLVIDRALEHPWSTHRIGNAGGGTVAAGDSCIAPDIVAELSAKRRRSDDGRPLQAAPVGGSDLVAISGPGRLGG